MRPMRMTWRWLLLAVGASVLVACSVEGPDAPTAFEDTTTGLAAILSGGLDERSQVPAPLRGTTWRLVSIGRGAESEGLGALDSALTFGIDDVSGKTCNSYGAQVAVATPDRITAGGFISTQMRCEGTAGDMDRLVQEVLHGGAKWQRQDATLTLARGDVTLAFALQPT